MEEIYITVSQERYAELIRYEFIVKMLREAQAQNRFGVPNAVEEMLLGKPGSEVADAE